MFAQKRSGEITTEVPDIAGVVAHCHGVLYMCPCPLLDYEFSKGKTHINVRHLLSLIDLLVQLFNIY